MADVLVGSDRRVLISGYGYGHAPQPPPPPPPPPAAAAETQLQLLSRVDQIDLRLRQLEEQRQRHQSHADHGGAPARRAPAAQHQHTKSLPAALRVELMDRLNLLESRIRQLSIELDLDVGGMAAGRAAHQLGLRLGTSSSVPPVEDPATWFDCAPVAVVNPAPAAFGGGNVQNKKSKPAAAAAGGSWSGVEFFQRGARQLHRSASSKPAPPTKVKNQKKEKAAERSKTSRRWFIVGC